MKKYLAGFMALMISASMAMSLTVSAEKGKGESFVAQSSAASTYLYPGDGVTVTLDFKSLTGFQRGINAYKGTLEYDNSIFNEVTSADFESVGKWTGFEYNPVNNQFIAYSKARFLSDVGAIRLNLKVKSDADIGSTSVKFSDITVSEGTEDITEDSEIGFEIIKRQGSSTNTPGNPGTGTPGGSGNIGGGGGSYTPGNTPSRTENNNTNNTNDTEKEDSSDNKFYFIEGAKLEYNSASGGNAMFRINADYSLFRYQGKVYVDSKLVDNRYYVSRSGSTIIELSESYLKTLKSGEHILRIALAGNNEVKTTFVIDGKEDSQDQKDKPQENQAADVQNTQSASNAQSTQNNQNPQITQNTTTVQSTQNSPKPQSTLNNADTQSAQNLQGTEVTKSETGSQAATNTWGGETVPGENPEESITGEISANSNVDDTLSANSSVNKFTTETTENEEKNIFITRIIIIAAIAVIALLFIIMAVVRKNKKTSTTLFIAFATLFSIGLGMNALAAAGTGEVSGDAVVDDTDIELIKRHIIGLGEIPEEHVDNADINDDGDITVTDLSLVILKAEESINYTVDITGVSVGGNDPYVEKNTDLVLKISAVTVNDSEIVGFTIDGAEYETELENGTYRVNLPGEGNPGIKAISFESARLDNGKAVELTYSKEIEVLKDLPVISDYLQTGNNKVDISFNLSDPDDSFLSGSLKIKDKSGNAVDSYTIKKGANTLEFNPGLSDSYRVDILVIASRYSDKSNSQEIKETKELIYKADYNPEISGLNLYKKGDMNTPVSSATLDDELVLGFEFGNAFDIEIDRLTINGKSYVLDGEESAYGDVTIELDNSALRIGENTIKISEIVLTNGVALETDESVKVNIVKRDPNVINLSAAENQDILRIDAHIKDTDGISAKNSIKILDEQGNIISEKEIKANKDEVVELDVESVITSKYIIEVYATIEGESRQIKSIEYLANPRIKVINAATSKELADKNETIEITYQIVTSAENLEAFIIDNTEIPVTLETTESGDTVKVNVNAPNTAGQHEFTLQAIKAGGNFISTEHKISLYITKSAPVVSVGEIVESEDSNSVTFKLVISDEDNAFVNGKMNFFKEGDSNNPAISENIANREVDSVTVELEENEKYTYEIESYYVRDPRVTNPGSEDVAKETVTQSGEYTLVKENDLSVKKIELRDTQNQVITSVNKNSAFRIYMEFETRLDTDNAQVIINEEKYDLNKLSDGYYVNIPAGESANGAFRVTNVILSTLKNITLKDPVEISIDTLKDIPVVDGFFVGNKKSNILVEFNLTDSDNAVTGGAMEIIDKSNSSVVVNEEISTLQKGANSLKYALTPNKNYSVKLTVKYSSTQTGAEEKEIVKNADYRLEVKDSVVEFKDVYNVTLYKATENGLVEDESIDKNHLPGETSNLYLKIDMKNLPTYYAGIESLEAREDKVYAILDETEFLQYTLVGDNYVKNENVEFEISYANEGVIQGGTGNARSFFETIAENPAGTFNLTRDLDATDIKMISPIVSDTFTGTLDGHGFTIYNLSTTLFKELNGATIRNINFENVNIKGNGNNKGLLATKADNSTNISNINVKNLAFASGASESGGLVGLLTNNSTVTNVYIENALFTGNHTRTGGIAGAISRNSSINKSVFDGHVKANSSTGEVGGIVGWGQNSTVGSVVYKGKITSENSYRVGAIIGYGNNSAKVDGSMTAADGENAYAVYGESAKTTGNPAWVVEDSNLILHSSEGDIESLTDKENAASDWLIGLFLGIDEENIERVANIIQREFKEPQINSTDTTNSTSVTVLTGYDKTKANLYNNLSKIMPFADAQIWIDSAKAVTNANLKNNKIKYVIPFAGNAQVVGLNRATAGNINKIKIVYEDDVIEEYAVALTNIADLVIAEYTVSALNIKYQYPAYLNTLDSELINSLVSAAEGYDYDTDIRLSANESRVYKDNYEDVIKPLLTELIANYISSQTKYPTYLSNVDIAAAIKNDLITNGRLKDILKAYSYYIKWYNINMGDSNVSDTVFLNSYINYGVSIEDMVDKVLAGTTGSAETQNFYGNKISQYTGKSLIDYLASLSEIYTGIEDPNEWFNTWFKGILIETQADSAKHVLKYRIWDNLAKTRQNLILPLLSAPNTEETYLVSIPTTIILGSLNKYMADPYDETSRNNFTNSATEYSKNFARVYGTSSNILPDGERLVNEGYTQMHFETRLGFHSGSKYPGTQSIYTTEDPTLKWIFGPIGIEVATNGAQAYGQGGDVLWEITSAIGQVYVASHESSHTQYRSYWYNGNGGRPGTGFEANADGALSQQVGDGGLVFNLYGNYNRDSSDISNNYSYERIDTPEKAFDFYKNLFDSSYVMDYLAAKAFLELDASVQAKVAVQARENKKGNTMSTTYARLTEEEIRNMNLSTIGDLIDNKIMVRNTGTVSEANDGTYGTESLWVFNWYQPHNDNGSPDDNTFKKLGWEMFGYKGIEGFYTYRSNLSKNDLEAIRILTDDEEMTWDNYKKMRFDEVERNISGFKYIDTDYAINQFKEAFKEDAITGEYNKSQNLKRIYHQIVKKKTDDYVKGSTYDFSPVVISSAKDLVDAINADPYGVYELDRNIDFAGVDVDPGKDYYMEKFVGTIDGKGHTISGVKYPLFNSTNFTSINNVVIDGSGYTGNTKAIIVINSKNTVLYNVTAQGIEFSVPYVRSTNGSYYEYGCNVETVNDIVISTPEDLINISNTGLNKTYRLGNNIDMSGQNVSGVVVPGTFTGTLDGKGFSITGLKNTLFQKTEKANIKNLVISDANVTGKSIVANEVTMETVISRVLIADSVFIANQNESGTFAGKLDSKSTIEMCAITGITISGPHTSIGGYVGAVNGNSTVTDCYIEGTIENTNGITGGIIGYGNGDSWIKDSIVKINLSNTTDSSGGVLGKINYARTGENCYVRNVLSLADGTSGNRIMRVDTTPGYAQYFNLRGSSGNNYAISTSKLAPYTIAVAEITPEGITEDFFRNTLRLRSDRWELSGAAADSLPVLKFLSYEASALSLDEDLEEEEVDESVLEDETFDEENTEKEDSDVKDTAVEDLDNEVTANEQPEDKTEDAAEEEKSAVIEIASLEDFLKIKDNLAGEYLLTKSISFEGVDIEEAAFIMGTFTGKLRGLDGCTITGLLKPLFEKIGDGAIIEVIIEMADISK